MTPSEQKLTTMTASTQPGKATRVKITFEQWFEQLRMKAMAEIASTTPAFSPEVVAGAIAAREKRQRFRIEPEGSKCIVYLVEKKAGAEPDHWIEQFDGSAEECQQWIDCQAFSAGLQALLPVSHEALDVAYQALLDKTSPFKGDPPDDCDLIAIVIKAIINHITSGSAQHGTL